MRIRLNSLAGLGSLLVLAFSLTGCQSSIATSSAQPDSTTPKARLLPDGAEVVAQTIRFLEERIKRDPDDFIAHNKLAGQYLLRLRETGDVTYLNLASKAANASMAVLPAEQNTGGLTVLAQVEYSSHEFTSARDHAMRLTELEPNKAYPYQILGDTFLELGEYDKAEAAFRQMQKFGSDQGVSGTVMEQRVARLASLYGDMEAAKRHMARALTIALALPAPPRETVAWCRWQLGEIAFAVGDYPTAERHYRDALTTFPDYFRALASLSRVRASQGDLTGAIEAQEHAVRIIPDPSFIAALGDLYQLAGRDKDATSQYALVEKIGRLSELNGSLYNRQLSQFYADHDLKPDQAYANAANEYAVRRDIYGADTLAWTALKAGKIVEAQTAIKDALRLGTKDARIFYHASMIARAAGDSSTAQDYYRRMVALNPKFDLMQAAIAKRAFE